MRGLLRELLEFLLPSACAGCNGAPGLNGRILCPACDARLPRLETPTDPRPPLALVRSLAAVSFEGAAEDWIHRFKYPASGLAGLAPGPEAVARMLVAEAAGHLSTAEAAGHLSFEEAAGHLSLAEAAGHVSAAADAVVAVPQHPRSLHRRGFWPAGKLAAEVAGRLDRRFQHDALARLRDTPSQTGLSRRERAQNVARAFEARRPSAGRIVLVDDVTTTGATLSECARALRRAGAREVSAVCAARRL